jgi:hypothetical protein
VSFASPFEVLTDRPIKLKPRDRKPPDFGPKVRVEAARLMPGGEEPALAALINGVGLRDTDRDGFKEQDANPKTMWVGAAANDLALEFELPDAVPIGTIEVWNYNAPWQTSNGIAKADVAVSTDGTTWSTVLRGAEFAEPDGRADYDEPTALNLKGVIARKVRLANIVGLSGGKIGLSEVVFHQAAGAQAVPVEPEDGASGIGMAKPLLRWLAGKSAVEHRVSFGTSPGQLALLGSTREDRLATPALEPDTTYFWRVDEVTADGKVISGRTARFATTGLAAWWKLDESEGMKAEDASGHQHTGNVVVKARWAPEAGRIGGAMEFDGRETFINCGRAPEFDFSQAMTVAAWIKVREFNKPYQAIVTRGDKSWRLQRAEDGGKVMFAVTGLKSAKDADKAGPRVISKNALDDGQWHHLVATYDGQRIALFVDGQLDASVEASGPLPKDSQSVMIGCNSQAYDRRFNGWIDEVRLYGYALSEREVQALFRGSESRK